MNSKKLFSFLLVFSIMLTGCGDNDKTATSSEPSDTQKTSELTIDKDGKKEESKDTDSKKQEKETSSSTKNETNSSKNKTSMNDSKDSGNKPSGNTGNSSTNKPSTSKPAHQHDWQPVYTTVHHEAQYRNEPIYKDEIVYEDRPVYKWQAYWTCNECNQRFEDEYDVADHAMYECGGGWTAHEEKIQSLSSLIIRISSSSRISTT